MADIIEYKIHGNDLQAVEVELDPGEGVRAEVGTMLLMEQGIDMQTQASGGLFSSFKRALTGAGFFITTFLNSGKAKARVIFAAPYPGKIMPLDLGSLGGQFLCQKDAFLCAAKGIEIDIAFTKRFGAGLFGGEGFILQKLSGEGLAFVHAGGAIIERDLQAGETLRVDTGCLVAFSSTATYDIAFIGGFKNALFGGEGLVLATLTGPGKVYLQSLPFSRLADRIKSAAFRNIDEQKSAAGIGSNLLGNLLGGNKD